MLYMQFVMLVTSYFVFREHEHSRSDMVRAVWTTSYRTCGRLDQSPLADDVSSHALYPSGEEKQAIMFLSKHKPSSLTIESPSSNYYNVPLFSSCGPLVPPEVHCESRAAFIPCYI